MEQDPPGNEEDGDRGDPQTGALCRDRDKTDQQRPEDGREAAQKVEKAENNRHHLTFENREDYLASLDMIRNGGLEIIDTRNVEGSLEEYFVKSSCRLP